MQVLMHADWQAEVRNGSNKVDPLAHGEPLPPIPSGKALQEGAQAGAESTQPQQDAAGSPREEDFEFAAMLKDMQVCSVQASL